MKKKSINTKTSLYAVLGNPIKHSLSPHMHNSAFEHINYNALYLAFEVQNIKEAVLGIKALGIKGASITIPHKVSAMDYIDEIDEDAVKIGAINTIVNKDGKLLGYNTDYAGAINAIYEKTTIKDKYISLIGAGGAARAIGYGIIKDGGKLTIFNKFIDEGELLAKDLGVKFYPISDFSKINCQILINATPLGMDPDIDTTPIQKKYLQKEMVVMDIVYNPLKTRLLKEAQSIGCEIINGVHMFVYQGVSQFELWTGQKAPVDIMKNAVLECLGK